MDSVENESGQRKTHLDSVQCYELPTSLRKLFPLWQTIFSKKWPTIEKNRSLKLQFGKKNKTSEFDLNQWSQRWCAFKRLFLIIQREPFNSNKRGAKKNCWWKKNPATQLIGSSSHYLQSFINPRWCRIPSINSMFILVRWKQRRTFFFYQAQLLFSELFVLVRSEGRVTFGWAKVFYWNLQIHLLNGTVLEEMLLSYTYIAI